MAVDLPALGTATSPTEVLAVSADIANSLIVQVRNAHSSTH